MSKSRRLRSRAVILTLKYGSFFSYVPPLAFGALRGDMSPGVGAPYIWGSLPWGVSGGWATDDEGPSPGLAALRRRGGEFGTCGVEGQPAFGSFWSPLSFGPANGFGTLRGSYMDMASCYAHAEAPTRSNLARETEGGVHKNRRNQRQTIHFCRNLGPGHRSSEKDAATGNLVCPVRPVRPVRLI